MGNLVNPNLVRLKKNVYWNSFWSTFNDKNYSYIISHDYFLINFINWFFLNLKKFNRLNWAFELSHYKILRYNNFIIILFFIKDYRFRYFIKDFFFFKNKLKKKTNKLKNYWIFLNNIVYKNIFFNILKNEFRIKTHSSKFNLYKFFFHFLKKKWKNKKINNNKTNFIIANKINFFFSTILNNYCVFIVLLSNFVFYSNLKYRFIFFESFNKVNFLTLFFRKNRKLKKFWVFCFMSLYKNFHNFYLGINRSMNAFYLWLEDIKLNQFKDKQNERENKEESKKFILKIVNIYNSVFFFFCKSQFILLKNILFCQKKKKKLSLNLFFFSFLTKLTYIYKSFIDQNEIKKKINNINNADYFINNNFLSFLNKYSILQLNVKKIKYYNFFNKFSDILFFFNVYFFKNFNVYFFNYFLFNLSKILNNVCIFFSYYFYILNFFYKNLNFVLIKIINFFNSYNFNIKKIIYSFFYIFIFNYFYFFRCINCLKKFDYVYFFSYNLYNSYVYLFFFKEMGFNCLNSKNYFKILRFFERSPIRFYSKFLFNFKKYYQLKTLLLTLQKNCLSKYLKFNYYISKNIEFSFFSFFNNYSRFLFNFKNYFFTKLKLNFIKRSNIYIKKLSLNLFFFDFKKLRESTSNLILNEIKESLVSGENLKRAVYFNLNKAFNNDEHIGLSVRCKGRFRKKGRAKLEKFSKGMIPLNTIVSKVDYFFEDVRLRNGICSLKVFLFFKNKFNYNI